MILVGQYDSPFVRRIAIALNVYGLPFTRDRTSVFSPEMDRINPLVRIPSLFLDDGEVIYDSAAILEYLDDLVGPEAALIPRSGATRRRVQRATVLGAGAVEKAGAVVYERHFHSPACVASDWVARCLSQLAGALDYLENAATAAGAPWLFGQKLSHADVMATCLVFYLRLRLVEAMPVGRYPALEALSARCETQSAFQETRPTDDEVMPAKRAT